MSFFVDKLGPIPTQPPNKTQKSAAAADLLKHPSKASTQAAPQAQPRAQAERAAPQPKVVDRAPAPPPKDEPKKKKGWFG
ncbi:MAG: hypothetical protein QM759_11420 [Terricaulis sp.]